MRLADEILLLLTDDASGAMSVPEAALDRAVAAAALADLEEHGCATLADADGEAPDGSGLHVSEGDVVLSGESACDDHVLAVAMTTYRGMQGRPLDAVLPVLGRALYPTIHRALADEGILERQAGPMSMRPTTRWVTTNPEPEREVRSVLRHVIRGEDVTGAQRRHARKVVVLLRAAGVLDEALSDLDPSVLEVARHTETPMDAGHVHAAVVRALEAQAG